MSKKKNTKISNKDLNKETISKAEDQAINNSDDSIGTPSYEELIDINEGLEKSILRYKADLDNALKRTISEVDKAHKYGIEKLLLELLPVIDNLENALENSSKDDKEGIKLTLKSFESALDKFGMIPIYPEDESFNPEKHEAVSMEKDKKKKDGEIGNIFQRGWELNGRIIRPARVTVIKN